MLSLSKCVQKASATQGAIRECRRSFHETNLVSLHDTLHKVTPQPMSFRAFQTNPSPPKDCNAVPPAAPEPSFTNKTFHPAQPLSTLTLVNNWREIERAQTQSFLRAQAQEAKTQNRGYGGRASVRPVPMSILSQLHYPGHQQLRALSNDTAKKNIISTIVGKKKKLSDNELHNMRYAMTSPSTPDFVRYDISAWKKWNGVPRAPTGKRPFHTVRRQGKDDANSGEEIPAPVWEFRPY